MILIPTILCGGAGSRLWPLSRSLHPKPFIRLGDGQSLLQKAFIRGSEQICVEEVLTVTNRELFFKTEDDYREINHSSIPTSFLLEPFAKNTAAAIAAATLDVVERFGSDALLLVLAADHLIKDSDAFQSAVTKATSLASEDKLVTFGIQPTSPETGYGYIETEGHEVKRFIEKPDLDTAKSYLASGQYLWNSGMFCFKAGVMLKEMQQHCPQIIQTVTDCMGASQKVEGNGVRQVELNPDIFDLVPEDSVDFAVFEKSSNIGVVPCDIGWSDIGSWTAMRELSPADEHGNRIDGKALVFDSRDCFIRSEDRMVGAVGLDNITIVDTADALLVVNDKSAQDVRRIYADLKNSDHDVHKLHRTVYRPWGHYTVLEEGNNFKIKRIQVKPRSSLSLQLHRHRSEHWVVIEGEARIINGEKELTIKRDESSFIPAGHKHRLSNPTDDELIIIEVQTGKYVGEDDIIRFEDKYGRS